MECECDPQPGIHGAYDEYWRYIDVRCLPERKCWVLSANSGNGEDDIVFEVTYCPFCGEELPKE